MLVTGGYSIGLLGVVGPRGHCPPPLETRTKKLYRRDAPCPLRAVQSHPRESLSLSMSLTAGVFNPFRDFGGNPFLGQEQAVTERSPRENVVKTCRLQHSLPLARVRAKRHFRCPTVRKKHLSTLDKAGTHIGQDTKRLVAAPRHLSPATPAPPLHHTPSHHRSRHRPAI